MSLKDWLIGHAIVHSLDNPDLQSNVNKIVQDIEDKVDERYGDTISKKIIERVVTKILLPISRGLMNDNQERYNQILEAEQQGTLNEA